MSEINTENIESIEPVNSDPNGSDNSPVMENNLQENDSTKSEEDNMSEQTGIMETSKEEIKEDIQEEVLDSINEDENKIEEVPQTILEDDINIEQPQEGVVEEEKVEELEEIPEKTETTPEQETITKEEIAPSEDQKVEEQTEEKQDEEQQEKPSWYIIHTYSGHEFKVKERIEQRAEAMNMTNKITKIIVPEEESVEIKNNKRLEKTNKMFPGYVFVEMVLDNESWFLIRKIPGVSKFLGPKSTPLPVTEKEMLRVLQQTGVKTKKIEVDFEIGELIKVISGPFRGYQGGINEIYPDRGKLKAKISIFGRETPVELDFDQVEKVIK